VTVQALRTFHDTFYRPNNAYLLLVGDVTPESAKGHVERSFGKWARSDTAKLPVNPLNKYTEYRLPERLTVNVVDMPGADDSTIVVGNLAIARGHEDWVPLALANTILGDDAMGRLFTDLREDKGLTYGVYSSIGESQAPGTFEIGTRTAKATTGAMLEGIFGHIARMRAEEPTEEEFRQAVDKLAGSFPLEVETAHDIAAKVHDSLVYGLPLDYWRAYWSEFAKVDRKSVRPVARRYMHAVPHVVVVGDLEGVRKQIRKALPEAEIAVWTIDLDRVKP
jgi:zinc protease